MCIRDRSYAGQYLTKLDVDKNSLIEDIFEVYRSQLSVSYTHLSISKEMLSIAFTVNSFV